MNLLENRIASFKKTPNPWPHTNSKYTIETFAKAGFYHVRRPKVTDSVRCFLCDLELNHWTKARSPYLRHTKESPHCPWVLLNFPDSLDSAEQKDPQAPESPIMQKARLLTFQHHNYWPPNKGRQTRARKYPVASKVAEAGFFFSPTSNEPARIKCPYCQVTISEPEKEVDLLQKHQTHHHPCSFVKLKSMPNIKRDTINSMQSSESFKTASSQLATEEDAQKRKRKQMASTDQNHSAKQKTDAIKEDAIWDIGRTFEATPPHIKKPAITFGKQSSKRDRKRQRILPSSKRESTIDIFSEALKPTSPFKPEASSRKPTSSFKPEASSHKPTEKERSNQPQASELPIASHPTEAPITSQASELPKDSQATTPKSIDHSPAEATVTITSPKRDKGKGRAVESPASIAAAAAMNSPTSLRLSNQAKKPISLSKSKTRLSTQLSQSSSISLRHSLPEEEEEMIFFHRPLSPKHSDNLQFLQSTPVHHDRNNQVSAADIFGDCPFSPITHTDHHPISDPLTPSLPTPNRIRPSVTQHHTRLKAFSPPKSPTSNPDTPPILSMGDILPQLPPAGISSEQKTMTVERFLQDTIEASIHKVKAHGSHVIEMIKQKSNQVKSELMQHTTSS